MKKQSKPSLISTDLVTKILVYFILFVVFSIIVLMAVKFYASQNTLVFLQTKTTISPISDAERQRLFNQQEALPPLSQATDTPYFNTWKTFSDTRFGFEVKYPANYRLDTFPTYQMNPYKIFYTLHPIDDTFHQFCYIYIPTQLQFEKNMTLYKQSNWWKQQLVINGLSLLRFHDNGLVEASVEDLVVQQPDYNFILSNQGTDVATCERIFSTFRRLR